MITLMTDSRRRAQRALELSENHHPKLAEAERLARLNLAAAINEWDSVERLIDSGDLPGRHSLQEQAAVDQAALTYANALADLLRGEYPEENS